MNSGYAITNRWIGSFDDFLISLILFCIFFLCTKKFIEKNNLNINFVIGLIIYRMLILLCLMYHSLITGVFDGHGIYNLAGPEYDQIFDSSKFTLKSYTGSHLLSSIIRPLVHYLNLSYLSVSLVFFYLGTFAILFCFQIYKKLNINNKYINIFIILFCFNPALNIFTVSITKDTIIFFITMLLLYVYFVEKYQIKKILLFSLVPLSIIYLIRPYTGGIMIASLIPYYILSLSKISFKKILSLVALFLFTIGIFYISRNLYAWNYNGGLMEQIYNFIATRQDVTNVGNTALDYKKNALISRFIQSIFGFGAIGTGFLAPIFIFDQIINLYLFLLLFFLKFNNFSNLRNLYFKDFKLLKLFIIYAFGLYFICAISLSNFGLILRLKWMYWPIVIFFIISLFQPNVKKN